MLEYSKTIPKFKQISAHTVQFSYKINNQFKFFEYTKFQWYFACFSGEFKVFLKL